MRLARTVLGWATIVLVLLVAAIFSIVFIGAALGLGAGLEGAPTWPIVGVAVAVPLGIAVLVGWLVLFAVSRSRDR